MSRSSFRRRLAQVAVAVLGTAVLAVVPANGAAAALGAPKKLIAADFPDPDIVRYGTTWYAYATNNSRHVPVASAPTVDGPWTIRGDALPGGPSPSWARSGRTWAPDVHVNPDGTLTMTYTAWHVASGRQCIGVATASSPLGPFTPLGGGPLICPTGSGGAIDANTFVASNGTRYLLWKNDGNAVGQSTTLWLSRTTNNGTALVGSATALVSAPAGQIVEAPDMVQIGSRYLLFFSRGGYGGCGYYTAYSVATSLNGPWSAARTLMTQANTGICGPGGADVVTSADGATSGDKVFFHGWYDGARHMLSLDLSWVDSERVSDFTGDGAADVLGVDAAGNLLYYPNNGLRLPASYDIGHGWSTFKHVMAADWSGDGKADVLGVDADGNLWYYPNNRQSLSTPAKIGHGWSTFKYVMAADWSGDGKADVVGVDASGNLWYYPHNGTSLTTPSKIGHGWSTFRHVKAADWSGDGAADILGVDASGNLWYYAHNGSGLSTPVKIGHGWSTFKHVIASDFSADGAADILGIDANGDLWYYPHNGSGLSTPVKIGHGWSTFRHVL